MRGSTLEILYIVLVVGGGLLALAGNQLALPAVRDVGFLVLFLGVVAFGLDMIIARRAELSAGQWARYAFEVFRGPHAVAWGIGFVILGAFFAFLAAASLVRGSGGTAPVDLFQGRPGLLVAVFGAVIAVWAFGQAGYATIRVGTIEHRVRRWEARISGVVMTIVGLAMFALGLLDAFAPETLAVLKQAALRWIESLFLD